MKKVKVKRDKLLEALRSNLKDHIAEYNTAVAEFKVASIHLMQSRIKEFEDDNITNLSFDIYPPTSHQSVYEEAISLVEMSCEDEIILDGSDARHYLLNNWAWRGELSGLRTMYAETFSGVDRR